MRTTFRLLCVILLTGVLGACSSVMMPIENRPLAPPRPVTLEELETTIALAIRHRKWDARKLAPGHIEATYMKSRHVVVVDVIFDTKSFSIRYKNSENMHYTGSTIHGRYNEWTEKLARLISARVRNM